MLQIDIFVSIKALYLNAAQDSPCITNGLQSQSDVADQRDCTSESDVKKKSWMEPEAEMRWGSARREPKSWWDAAYFLLVRNVPAFCELSCSAALIAVGIARYKPFPPSTELMLAAVTRYSAVTVTLVRCFAF
jgi:hypothetical protein